MKRELYNDLILWKNKSFREPLLIQGVRQVGKTYLVNQFGQTKYENFIYLNFEKDDTLKVICS